jgi:uncharacterized protein (TIRG00374 family)
MSSKTNDVLRIFSFRRVLIPILLGLAGASYLLVTNIDQQAFHLISWNSTSFLWMLAALLMVVTRDLGYMYRIRVLTDNHLSWKKSFDVIMLWEFASAITPSVVGGSGVALYILSKEGISIGKSTSVVMVTALLDEVFFILMVPVVFLIVGAGELFPVAMERELFGITLGTKGLFMVGYLFILAMTTGIVLAIFVNPRAMKAVILSVFKIRWLRKWRYKGIQVGDDIITTSRLLKNKPISFWVKTFTATFLSWTARYWVVNFMLLAFIPVGEHFLIYARQLVMWVIMLMSPTPGGSGIAEFAFSGFLREFTMGLGAAFAILWRLLTYYPYLFVGSIVLPGWVKRTHFSA